MNNYPLDKLNNEFWSKACVTLRPIILGIALSISATVSQVICKNLSVAKNLGVIRTWLVAEIGKLGLVLGVISSL